ncbi:uncharacterized protein si:dkey-106l3.7 isoform X2 [Micropterus salmoides]|uniref:uncharacterized protein si:dkey-106l3.7 isoform X2 n=1 Tax=Micropterus salmoides TaxID=27706 RepID=UPI0018EAA7C7|nr:uncharacterized protein si:dkey-106l3.7 isoform X2 [Micropterus salmoides]
MNLYRSFGNLMEAWISEGGQCSDSDCPKKYDEDSPTPSSDMGTNLRSESVDSGVETASSDTTLYPAHPAISCCALTENAETDTFTPEREVERLTAASTSQSPVLLSSLPSSSSISSSCLCHSRAQERSTTLHQKVEQALQRTDSKHLKDNPKPLTVDEVLRRRPRAFSLPNRHTSDIMRSQLSDTYALRTTANPSVSMIQMCGQLMAMSCNKKPTQTRLENPGKEEGKGLSPGLSYLEQVCQMLEEIARQQMHSRALQMETKTLRELQDAKALYTCQNDSKAAEEDLSSCQRLKNTESADHSSSKTQQQKDYPDRYFRPRSASDSTIAALHLRTLNADCRGQHLSTDDLPEKKTNKIKKNWKLKIGSLRREDPAVRDGQKMQPSEKKSARRRLSQLFRKNSRKTLPM